MKDITFGLIHSPLVGPLTWQPVQHVMAMYGFGAIAPALSDDPGPGRPFWQQHAESAAAILAIIPPERSIVLVAHSGAGALLPAIRQLLDRSIHAYLFVDSGVPHNTSSRLDLMRLQDPQWTDQFHKSLLKGERFPAWSEDDLQEVIPDEGLRRKMAEEIRPRDLPFFSEPIPVFSGWPDAPCAFIKLSAAYSWDFEQARRAGWPVRSLEAGHFHMLVDPLAVTNAIVEAVEELYGRQAGGGTI